MSILENDKGSEQSNTLVDLFSRSSNKPSPKYDYSVIPSRVPKDDSDDELDEEKKVDEKKKKKKPKSGLRGLRKKAAAEAGGEVSKENFKSTKIVTPKDAKEDAYQESKEILKLDRMKQVKHEDSKKRIINQETEERTVFVGNLINSFQKKDLKKLFSRFGTVETVRFRCAARPDMKTTKKEAVIKHKLHEDRTSFAAYVRFSKKEEAESATQLNGEEVEGHIVRVDLALAGTKHDNKKAVFLGNLDFKVQEADVRKLFAKCGEIDNVRLIRDSATGIGKGFGYVNFGREESVDLALRLINQVICGRKVRVTRAVRKAKPGKFIASNIQKRHQEEKKGAGKSKINSAPTKRSKEFKKKKDEVKKSFQGVSTTNDAKPKKRHVNKTERRNKILAEKLSA